MEDWVMPDFRTMVATDEVVASIVFMGAMRRYFDFGGRTGCGLLSVTLLEKKTDWENILKKPDGFPELGVEPKQWHKLLVPVLKKSCKLSTSLRARRRETFGERYCTTIAEVPDTQIITPAG